MTKKQQFEEGKPFQTIIGIFMCIETPYGLPYLATLHHGTWIFAFHILGHTEHYFSYQVKALDQLKAFQMDYESLIFLK